MLVLISGIMNLWIDGLTCALNFKSLLLDLCVLPCMFDHHMWPQFESLLPFVSSDSWVSLNLKLWIRSF